MSQFSDAYKKHLTDSQVSLSSAPKTTPKVDFSGLKNLAPAEGKQDFLSWLTDILSRPLYSVTNVANQGFNEIQKAADNAKAGRPTDILGGLANIATSSARGFLSTDKNDKATTSKLIEKGTDAFGTAFNPDYKNDQDNVNPVLKGSLGLVGDIALDPTTYLGGAGLFKKGAELGAKGVEDGGDLVKTLLGTEKAKAAPEVIEDTSKIPAALRPAAEAPSPEATLAERMARPELGTTAKAESLTSDVTKRIPTSPVMHPDAYVPSKVIAALDRTQTAKSLIKELSKPAVSEAAAKATTDFTKPLPMGRWLEQVAKAKPQAQVTANLKLGDLMDDPGLMKIPENKEALNAFYKGYTDAFVRVQAKGKYLHPSNKVTTVPKPPTSKPVSTLEAHTMMTRFRQMHSTEQGQERLEAAFGVGLTDRFRRKVSPARFDGLMQDVSDVLNRNTDLDIVKDNSTLTDGGQEILKALGVDPAQLNDLRASRLTQDSRVAEVDQLKLQAQVDATSGAETTIAKDTLEEMKHPDLTPAAQEVLDSVPKVWKSQFVDRHEFVTRTGVERTAEQQGYGVGKRSSIFNQYAQMTLRKGLTDKVFERLKGFKGSAKKRAEEAQHESMTRMKYSDEMAAHFGVPLYIGVSGLDALPLSLHQAYSLLDNADHPATLRMLWNQGTAVPDTNIADAINIAYRGGTHEEMVDAILSTTRRNLSVDGKSFSYPNRLVDNPSDLTFGHYGRLGVRQKTVPKAPAGSRLVKNGDKGWFVKYDPKFLAEEYVSTIEKAMPKIKKAVERNYADYQARLATESAELTASSMQKIEMLYDNPNIFSDAMHAIADAPHDIADTAQAAHATQDAVDASTFQVEGHIDVSVDAPSRAAVANEKISKSTKPALGNTARWREVNRFDKTKTNTNDMLNLTGDDMSEASKIALAEEAASGDTAAQAEVALRQKIPAIDVSDDVAWRTEQGVHRVLDPLRRIFDSRFKNARVFDVSHGYNVLSDGRRTKVGRDLSKLGNQYGDLIPGTETSYLQKAWQDWSLGIRGTDDMVNQAIDDIDRIWGRQWVGEGAIVNNDFFRNSSSIYAAEQAISETMYGVRNADQYVFDLERASRDAALNGTDQLTEAMKQVREWPVEDPIDFMHRMYVATEKVATRASVAGNFVQHFGKLGLVSHTPKEGFVRIEASGKNVYTDFLPEGIFVDPDLANEWKVFDKISSMSRTPDGDIGKAITKYFDPLQRAWKYAITLPRPGHHIRNLIGDWSMTFVARGTRYMRRSTNDAFKLLSMSRGYDGVDLNRVMAQVGTDALPKGADIISDGAFGKVTFQEALDAAYRTGMFPSFSSLEDLIGVEQKSGFQNIVDKLTLRGGKIENALGTVSEYRDHYSRLQHFMQAVHQMQKGGLKGGRKIEDVWQEAAREVRKYHPDGSSLTPFEAKYMRRIIPFYTWFRGVFPTIITSTMQHPGRVLAFPKSSYNLAVAMGLNPDSLSDPFPTDQLFPSFLTDQASGPQFQLPDGRYIGFSPGIAHFDVANTLTDPIRGLAGMVTPVLRVPAELIGGSQWGTGSKIRSIPDYIDQNIPGVNYVSNISGISPTGTAANFLQGNFAAQKQASLTPNKNGEVSKDLTDQLISGFNWTTGLGAVDMSRPSYINYAQIEKRNAATGG